MSAPRIAVIALAAGFGSAALVGCGVNTDTAGKGGQTPSAATVATTSTTGVNTVAAKSLPHRANGVVAVEGPRQGSLTPLAIRRTQGPSVTYGPVGDPQGVRDLCAGRIDVLDTSQVLSAAVLRQCRNNGVELIDSPLEVASDAVVVATRNESDVGGDCTRLSTLNDIYRSGSPYSNWSQVGFFDYPLRVTGREATSPTFQFFAATALGVPANASLADVRADYILHTTDDGVRNEVTGAARADAILARYLPRIKALRQARRDRLAARIDRAETRARRDILREIDKENRQRAAAKITLTERQKKLIERNNTQRFNDAVQQAHNVALRTFTYSPLRFLQRRIATLLRRARVPGTIGVFRFSYYELYENLLRPMEIWDPARAAQALSTMNGVKVIGPYAAQVDNSAAVPAPVRTVTTTTPSGTTTTRTETVPQTTSTVPSGAQTDAQGNVLIDPSVTPWCVFPSQTTITNGSYPLSRRLFLYVSKTNIKRPEVRTFLRTYLQNAQGLATSNRLVPIPDDLLEEQLAIVNGTPLPSETTTTSTTSTTSRTATTATTPTTTSTTAAPGSNVPGVASGTTTAP